MVLALVASLSSPVASGQSSSIVFNTPINLSNDVGQASFPWITNVGTNVYVAWSELGAGLFFRSSSDGGYNWNPPVSSEAMILSHPGGVTQAPIVCATGSDVYVSWSQTVGTTGLQVFVASSTNKGASFSPAVQLSSGSPPNGWITPVCTASGPYAYVAWINGSPNASWLSSSSNNGASWSAPYYYGASREPEAASVGSNAYIYSNRDLIVSHNGGASWKQVLVNQTLLGDEGQIAASGPYVYIATQTKTPSSYIHLYYSDNSGNSFHHINDSTPNLNDSWEPMVGAYGSSAWVAFIQFPGGANSNISVFTTHNGGATWSSPVSISGSGHDENYPFTVASSDGQNVFVGFTQEEGPDYWVFRVGYSSDGGNTWTAIPGIDVSQNTVGEAAFQNDLATGAIAAYKTQCYATWEYVNGATTQVYFATSAVGTYSTTSTTSSSSSSSLSSTSMSSSTSSSSISSTSSSSALTSLSSSTTSSLVTASGSTTATLSLPPVSTTTTSSNIQSTLSVQPWAIAAAVVVAIIVASVFVALARRRK
jgi:hypothetical protein